jgi:molybdopterin-guanine dinucleotide biosynthesis protein B
MRNPPVVQVVGYKNSGKTTLITKLIRHFKSESGWQIATIKHDHAQFELDHPGRDTWQHRQAGADLTMIQSCDQLGMTMQLGFTPSLEQLYHLVLQLGTFDLLLVEGFKDQGYPKLVLLRSEQDLELVERLSQILAVVVSQKLSVEDERMILNQGIEILQRDDEQAILRCLTSYLDRIRGKKDETV